MSSNANSNILIFPIYDDQSGNDELNALSPQLINESEVTQTQQEDSKQMSSNQSFMGEPIYIPRNRLNIQDYADALRSSTDQYTQELLNQAAPQKDYSAVYAADEAWRNSQTPQTPVSAMEVRDGNIPIDLTEVLLITIIFILIYKIIINFIKK